MSCLAIHFSSSLMRTQSMSTSPLSRFPEEVLSEIFMIAVFGYENTETRQLPSMEEDVFGIYRHIYRISGVCSFWRSIMLARGAFWSVIPMITSRYTDEQKPFRLILPRARGSKLHLAATISPSVFPDFVEILAEYGPRFRTLNFRADSCFAIVDIIEALLQHESLTSLSELSFQVANESHLDHTLPSDSDYVFSRDSPLNPSLPTLLGMLSAFRISGANFHWDTMVSSSRLVALHIEDVTLGYDTIIVSFLHALSSASELQDLKIVSVATLHNSDATFDADAFLPVTFPNLRSLYLHNLYFNTLECMLSMIVSPTYQVSLSVTCNCFMTHTEGGFDDNEVNTEDVESHSCDDLCRLLADIPVYTLTTIEHCWLLGPTLHRLLSAAPALKTLKLDTWSFDVDVWKYLERSQTTEGHLRGSSLPALENLHLTSARIFFIDGFKEMVASHPLQQLVIGGTLLGARTDGSPGFRSFEENNDLIEWLKVTVPDVFLMDSKHHLLECYPNVWRLW
ncbi:hypothetical protein B0J17DRAFT_680507 [Rhizoctonia solani]|nr:hypothetical protein B0J17DRAFT_680507 [Rhizoctonia solani]